MLRDKTSVVPFPGAESMRAAWWWIDRWRGSTAFSSMTAEEQGLYRNLCDEIWIREGRFIPDDPVVLSRASGDPIAWGRCGKKVLRWMKRVDGGWTNDTALEVIAESERKAKNQRAYRQRGGNKRDNGADNDSDNGAASKSQSPSKAKSTDKAMSPVSDELASQLDREHAALVAESEGLIRQIEKETGMDPLAIVGHPDVRGTKVVVNASGIPATENAMKALRFHVERLRGFRAARLGDAAARRLGTGPQMNGNSQAAKEAFTIASSEAVLRAYEKGNGGGNSAGDYPAVDREGDGGRGTENRYLDRTANRRGLKRLGDP